MKFSRWGPWGLTSLAIHGALGWVALESGAEPARPNSGLAMAGDTFEISLGTGEPAEIARTRTSTSGLPPRATPSWPATAAPPTEFEPGEVADPRGENPLDLGDLPEFGTETARLQPAPPAPPATRIAASRRASRTPTTRARAQESGARESSEGPPRVAFGALGDRSATDLVGAFTRGFPQAASADPVWSTTALGSAGEVLLTLNLDASGHLVGHSVSPGGTTALMRGITRTMALLGQRAFTANGPTTRLRIRATVSPDTVHDGLHGDVFALGGSAGSAFFALSIGRRIDVRITPAH